MKTAFRTSVVGILAGSIIKIKMLLTVKKTNTPNSQASVDHMLDLLTDIKHGIVGQGDSSICTQLQKTRVSIVDKHDELKDEFVNFAEKMVENNSNALIEVLEGVIKDFNQKISEQFGENFKHLNEGVGNMLKWQQEKKILMETTTKQIDSVAGSLQIASNSIENATEQMGRLAGQSTQISSIVNDLADLVEKIETSNSDSRKHISDIAGIAEIFL